MRELSHTLRLLSCTAEPAASMHSLVSSSRTCGLALVLVLVHHSAVGSAPSTGHGVVLPANACKLCLAFGMTGICKFCITRPAQVRFENCVTWLYMLKAVAVPEEECCDSISGSQSFGNSVDLSAIVYCQRWLADRPAYF